MLTVFTASTIYLINNPHSSFQIFYSPQFLLDIKPPKCHFSSVVNVSIINIGKGDIMYNKKLIPIICVIIALLLNIGCDITKNEKLVRISFNIKNETTETISEGFIRLPGTSQWESILTDPLPNGETRFVTISTEYTDSQYKTDLQMITAGGIIYSKLSYVLNTNNNGVVAFTTDDVAPNSPRQVTLRNETGQAITYGFASYPGSAIQDTLFNSTLPTGSSQVVAIPINALNSHFMSDLTLVSQFGVWFSKTNQIIEHRATITFTANDFNPDIQWPVSIRNNTGFTAVEGFVRLPGNGDWIKLFTSDLFTNETQPAGIPTIAINSNNATDIRLVTINDLWYTKPDLVITANAVITFSSSDFDTNGPRAIIIANNTGETITNLFASLPDEQVWECVFTGTIATGSTRQITIPVSVIDSQRRSDIRLESTFGVWYSKFNIEVIHNGNVSFTLSDLDPNGPVAVNIENISGEVFTTGFTRPPGSEEWTNIFTSTLANDNTQLVGIPLVAMNSTHQADIQLRTADEVLYTKYYITMVQNGTITFTTTDFDLTGPRNVVIQNNTEETLSTGFVTLPGTTNWVSLFSSSIIVGGSLTVTVPANAINSQNNSNFQLVSSNGVLYMKSYQTVIHKDIITFTIADIDENNPRNVIITNNTGQTIVLGNIRFPGSQNWSNLFTSTISNGSSITTNISTIYLDIEEKADLQLKNASGVAFTKLSQPIIHNATITFTAGDLELTVNIRNYTGSEIAEVFAKLPSDDEWTNLFITTYISVDATHTVWLPSSLVNEQSQCDLQLRTSSGVLYTKTSSITPNANITFTNSDIDPLSPRTILVQNNTGKTLGMAFAKLPGRTGWGDNILDTYIQTGTSQELTLQLDTLDELYKTDLMLKTWEEVPFIKLAVSITHYGVVTFTTIDTRVGKIGSAGGYIFYDQAEVIDDWQYLEAAPATSEVLAEWGLHGVDCIGTSTEIGTGLANTATIITHLTTTGETGKAAQLCNALSVGGFTGWFLPSKDELNQMYVNLAESNLGGFDRTGDFPASYYWSSSTAGVTTIQSWMQRFSDGGVGYTNDEGNIRESAMKIRAVRRY